MLKALPPAPPPNEGETHTPGHYDWRTLVQLARPHRAALIKAHAVAVFATLAAVPIPLMLPIAVDEVLLHQPGRFVPWVNTLFTERWHGPVLYITTLLLLSLFMRLISSALGVWQTRDFTVIAKDITFQIRRQLLLRLSNIALAEYETLGSGAVASHFVTDLDAVDTFIGTTISKVLVAVLSILGTAGILLWMHWPMALFILLLNPVVIWLTTVMGKRVKDLKRRENSAFEAFQAALTETLDAVQQIRAANRERHYLLRVVDRARDVRTHAGASLWKSDAASRASMLVFMFGFDAFRALSMLMVVYSDLTIGQMMAVFGYLWFMMGPVQELLAVQYAWYGARAALERINRLLDLREEPRWPALADPFAGKTTVSLTLDDVTFQYGDGPLVLDHVSLAIQPGEKVALVGASGGGKSTLVQVILGLYMPQSGLVRFGDVPVTEIGVETVRENVACVLQHPALFNDSVRANLTLGRELRDTELWAALEVAQLANTVHALPEGLDTRVGRQGIRLSGGQRQRLAVARMVLSNPKVVLLDEATSALDTETEARLHAALHDFLRERTTLIIAHRLSAVRQADRVYVFDGGRIAESGAHAELVAAGGLYARLYGRLQG